MNKRLAVLTAAFMLGTAGAAHADISACISVSATGPASALGVPQQNTVALLPAEAGGQKIAYTVYDDATDPSIATQNARKCVDEKSADILIGGSATPIALAIAAVASETKTPYISLAPAPIQGDSLVWSFTVPQPMGLMVDAMVQDMKARGFKTLGFIGYNDGLGDLTIRELEPRLKEAGIVFGPVERFARSDTSVAAQALKLVAANPDAVFVSASGAPAAGPNLALAERGYKGQIYHTHGSASPSFLKVAGASAEGTMMPVGALSVADLLADDNPAKAPAVAYQTAYEAANGAGTVTGFGGYMYDAGLIVAAAVPAALEKGQPGSAEFRSALRDAIEATAGVAGTQGVYAASKDNHNLSDNTDSRIPAVVKGGRLTPAN